MEEEGDKNKGTTKLHSKTGGWRAEKCPFMGTEKGVRVSSCSATGSAGTTFVVSIKG